MNIITNNNKRSYKFNNKKRIIGEIIVKLIPNKKVRLLKLNFIKGEFNENYWNMVIDDLINLEYNYFYLLLEENMKYFDDDVKLYKLIGFKTNFKKYPISVYYKDDEVYRLIHMFKYIIKN